MLNIWSSPAIQWAIWFPWPLYESHFYSWWPYVQIYRRLFLTDCQEHSVVLFRSKTIMFRIGFRFLILNRKNGVDDVMWCELWRETAKIKGNPGFWVCDTGLFYDKEWKHYNYYRSKHLIVWVCSRKHHLGLWCLQKKPVQYVFSQCASLLFSDLCLHFPSVLALWCSFPICSRKAVCLPRCLIQEISPRYF